MQGIYINGRRPLSKKAVKEAVAATPNRVQVEATSMMGREYDGPVSEMPAGMEIYFVGPDPYTSRKFYGSITQTSKGPKVS